MKLLAERGATVIFEVPESLHTLLRSLEGVTRWVRQGEPLPPFDCYCPLLSLPLAFKTTMNTIPRAIPYLRADPQRVQYWGKRLGEANRLRVGMVWSAGVRPDLPDLQAANDRRNIPLVKLAALHLPTSSFTAYRKGNRRRTNSQCCWQAAGRG